MNSSPANYYRLGLIGWPVGHSLSPPIHEAAFRATGTQGEYKLYPVDPDTQNSSLSALLSQLRSGEIHGLNVTVPYKAVVAEMVDRLSDTARITGAVNTLSWQLGQIVGDNSDVPGFLQHLQRINVIPQEKSLRCVLLGAGGSARAVAFALASTGHQVILAARRIAQAEQLAAEISRSGQVSLPISVIDLDFRRINQVINPDLLINTTPVGMHPATAHSPWPEEIPLPRACFVYDLIYNPAETRLLQQARQAGLPASNGLGMLVEQAAIAFQIWTGHRPPTNVLYQAVGQNLPVSSTKTNPESA
ncbi:MAG TPA: shikimate dehydrogenase [Anaerolineales bacterium]|nr:shikimate dehydrogenase [Anaerolineales bacterium]